MKEHPTWKVKILTLGKTAVEVKAEDAVAAVNAVVTDLAKRVGERVDIMARRLDRTAEVKGETGPAMTISVTEACPALTSLEEDIAEGIAQELSSRSEM